MRYLITEVASSRQLKQFVNFPYDLYKDCEYWIPPLRMEQFRIIDPTNSTVYTGLKSSLFLCVNNQNVVGRIALIRKNEPAKTASFGFYEAVEDPEVSKELFKTIEQIAREEKIEVVHGPFNPSTNYTCGLLVNEFNKANTFMMPYNFEYYSNHLISNGYSKVKDLLAFEVTKDSLKLDILNLIPMDPLVKYRTIKKNQLGQEIEKIVNIYNNAWSNNWGFVPISVAMARQMAKDLKMVIDDSLVIFAEKEGREIGFIMGLPDLNMILGKLNGNLLPFGWIKLLAGLKTIKKFRVITLGVVKDHQNSGVAYELIKKLITNGLEKGYVSAELSWILEDNTKMTKPLPKIGAVKTQLFRIYEKKL